jgi:hypothetical protein
MIDGMQIEAPLQADRSVFSMPYIFFIRPSQEIFWDLEMSWLILPNPAL